MPKKFHPRDYFEVCGSRPPARLLARLLSWEANAKKRFCRNGHKWLTLTHAQLADDMSVSPSTIARSIKHLEERGLIELVKAPHPTRPSILHCTWVRVKRDKLTSLDSPDLEETNEAICAVQNSQSADFLSYTNKDNKIQKVMKGDEGFQNKNYEEISEEVEIEEDIEDDELPIEEYEGKTPQSGMSAKDLAMIFQKASEAKGQTHNLEHPKLQDALNKGVGKLLKAAKSDPEAVRAAVERYVVDFDGFLAWAQKHGRLKNAKSKTPNAYWLDSQAVWVVKYHLSCLSDQQADEKDNAIYKESAKKFGFLKKNSQSQ